MLSNPVTVYVATYPIRTPSLIQNAFLVDCPADAVHKSTYPPATGVGTNTVVVGMHSPA